jgi:hypothetical protein
MASWKITVDISPVCAARKAADPIFFAVILPPESELVPQPRPRNRRAELMGHLYPMNAP